MPVIKHNHKHCSNRCLDDDGNCCYEFDYSKLSDSQKEFITRKVAELGSVEAVESFYSPHPKCKDQSLSIVDLYARHCIPGCWKKGGSPR